MTEPIRFPVEVLDAVARNGVGFLYCAGMPEIEIAADLAVRIKRVRDAIAPLKTQFFEFHPAKGAEKICYVQWERLSESEGATPELTRLSVVLCKGMTASTLYAEFTRAAAEALAKENAPKIFRVFKTELRE